MSKNAIYEMSPALAAIAAGMVAYAVKKGWDNIKEDRRLKAMGITDKNSVANWKDYFQDFSDMIGGTGLAGLTSKFARGKTLAEITSTYNQNPGLATPMFTSTYGRNPRSVAGKTPVGTQINKNATMYSQNRIAAQKNMVPLAGSNSPGPGYGPGSGAKPTGFIPKMRRPV